MQWVAADVHHVDIYVTREDGSRATPKFIAFLDLATNRCFIHMVVCEEGTAIRQADVTEALALMCGDPNWGVPENLYLDRGSEFGHLTNQVVNGLLSLGHRIRVGDFRTLDGDLDKHCGVHRALPHHPWSKVIETLFSNWEALSRPIDGALNGIRELSPTNNLGRPAPAHGTTTQYADTAREIQRTYHNKPQAGHLKGMSPNEAFKRALNAGWKTNVCDPLSLALAIMPRKRQRISAGRYVFEGRNYQCNEALGNVRASRFERVSSPILDDPTHVIIDPTTGTPIGYACPATPAKWDSMDCAKETAARARICLNRVRGLASEVNVPDMHQLMRDYNALAEPAPQAEVGNVIEVDPKFTAAAAALREASREEAQLPRIETPSSDRTRAAVEKMKLRERKARVI